jgi:tetrapyrrole methylase family protein/MazG family protein
VKNSIEAIEYLLSKNIYSFDDLCILVSVLRSENGCPWDREQTNKSIRNCIIDETYEFIEGLDNEDNKLMCEELGDVLFQVVFHTQITKEDGKFDVNNVIDGICKKMIERHPHVFGDTFADTSEKVLENWEKIKNKSKQNDTATKTLESVPMAFPALFRAQKVQKRAAKAGFDWDEADGAVSKLHEELKELEDARKVGNSEEIFEEFGDLLFSAVNVARFLKIDAEDALQFATEKFIKRFSKVEDLAIKRGINMKEAPLEELDALWDEIKHQP